MQPAVFYRIIIDEKPEQHKPFSFQNTIKNTGDYLTDNARLNTVNKARVWWFNCAFGAQHWRELLDRSEIQKLANLAQLDINDGALDEVASSITNVLALVDQLTAADTQNIAPMAHPLDAIQRLRADEVTEGNVRDKFQAIAPAVEDGLFLVPKVID